MFNEPERGRCTVLRGGRPRMLGRQTVVDADDGDVESVCELTVTHVSSRCGVHVKAAVVYVQIGALALGRG